VLLDYPLLRNKEIAVIERRFAMDERRCLTGSA
jgi:hypothetical protein